MNVYSLVSRQPHDPAPVSAKDGAAFIRRALKRGVVVETRTFFTPRGEEVSALWTRTASGEIETLWEHVYPTGDDCVPGAVVEYVPGN